ncbi:MAG: lamin tail domain-containing protein, partial [Myxococcaceae bacterium]
AGEGTCIDQGAARPILFPSPGDLVISELMPDPGAVADSDGEWLEVHARADLDLNWLELSNGGTGKAVVSQPGCLRVAAGGYAVFARDADGGANGGLPEVAGVFGFGLTNSGGTVVVKFPDGGVLDQASWTRASAGVSSQLDPLLLDATSNDSPSNFCPASRAYGKGDKGTPGAANDACPVVVNPDECIDPASGGIRAISRPGVGGLVITEFLSNPKSTDDANGEWIEVLVKADCDLNGLSYGNEGASPSTLASSTCVARTAGSYVLFAKSTDPLVNGGLPDAVAGTFGYS